MTRTRLGLLVLCAVVFGLVAFGAAAAQGETGARWLVLNTNGTLLPEAELKAAVNLSAETTGVLHSKIGGVSVLFECTTLAAINANLLANGSIGEGVGAIKGSKVKFSGCITKLNGVTSAACQPSALGKEPGVINTNLSHGLIVLHTKVSGVKIALVQVLPDNVGGVPSNKFATIEMGEECSIGTKVPVIGKAFLRDSFNALSTHLVEHLVEVDGFNNSDLTKLFVISETPEHVATILGSGLARLSGPHLTLQYGGDPA